MGHLKGPDQENQLNSAVKSIENYYPIKKSADIEKISRKFGKKFCSYPEARD